MTEEDWNQGFARSLGVRLSGDAIAETDAQGDPIKDDTFLILLNAHHEPLTFILPAHKRGVRWELVFDTRDGLPAKDGLSTKTRSQYLKGGASYDLEHRSMVLLRLRSR
jgi:glycogen operon protein